MSLEEFRRRRANLPRVELAEDNRVWVTEVREDMRRTLYDDIAAAAIDDVVAGFEVLLIWEADQ